MSKTPYDPNNPDVDAILQQQRKAWKCRKKKQRFAFVVALLNIVALALAVVVAFMPHSWLLPSLMVVSSILSLFQAILIYTLFRPDPQPPTVQDELEAWRG